MSRVGKQPVPVPSGVTVEMHDGRIVVSGPKGTLEREPHPDMTVRIEAGAITVERPSDGREHRSLHGLTRTLIANMVTGVTDGFRKSLDLVGVGYRAQMQDRKLVLQVGFSHSVEVHPPQGVELSLETFTPMADNNYLAARIIVEGIDKQKVGQLAADIRAVRKPEPYKGKGLRYTGEVVRRKAGKAAVKVGIG
ncbi:MAG: 50S ribosomal protein L6 [Armatimonadota bacterium]|nr:MAG: 50S ribosomal protein L6 [Armatimonadota bacterium]